MLALGIDDVASILPSAMSLASFSTSEVCGVIGYTATMSGRASATPSAAASLPSHSISCGAGRFSVVGAVSSVVVFIAPPESW